MNRNEVKPMTTEQLLIPRYKVIAEYPNSPYEVGMILNIHEGYADKFPAIFRRMNWNEGRDVDGMYIKSKETGRVYKYTQGYTDHFKAMNWNDWLPATLEEYEAFKNQQK